MFFDTGFALKTFGIILEAVPMTLLISSVSMIIGLVIGLLIAIVKVHKVPVLKNIVAVYVSFIRGTPMLVQLYVALYGLPKLFDCLHQSYGWNVSSGNIPSLAFALTAFILNASAYLSETIRSALSSVDKGQIEAAYSVGMTYTDSLIRIVIPQALTVALPNLSNLFLELIKGTSLAFSVMVVEIMASATIEASNGYKYLEAYVDAAIIYFIICFIFAKIFKFFEKKLIVYKNIKL